MARLLVLCIMLLSLAVVAPAAGAQDASPVASPTAGLCEAAELPPGTPTAMEEGTPESGAETTPGAEEETAPAPPAGTPAPAAEADAAEMALENLFNCINAGDYLAAAALMTDNFIQNFIEVPTAYDVPASFEGVQPIDVRSVGNAQVYDDGRLSVDVVYTGLFNGPGQLGSGRWFFAEENGVYRLDNFQEAPLPEGVLPDATVVTVQMVDFAFALDTYTIPAGPVILRTTNNSGTGSGHVNVVVALQEGTSAEQVIEGEVNLEEESTGFFGAVFLEPGQTGDLAFESLEPGTYFLVCDVETEAGTPHYELGMVSQVTVEQAQRSHRGGERSVQRDRRDAGHPGGLSVLIAPLEPVAPPVSC